MPPIRMALCAIGRCPDRHPKGPPGADPRRTGPSRGLSKEVRQDGDPSDLVLDPARSCAEPRPVGMQNAQRHAKVSKSRAASEELRSPASIPCVTDCYCQTVSVTRFPASSAVAPSSPPARAQHWSSVQRRRPGARGRARSKAPSPAAAGSAAATAPRRLESRAREPRMPQNIKPLPNTVASAFARNRSTSANFGQIRPGIAQI